MKANRLSILILALLFALVPLTGFTAEKAAKTSNGTGTSWMYHDIVDLKFVQQYAKMPKSKEVLIIDSRPKKPKFDKGYIPTAINIPGSQFAKMTDQLPKDKNTLLIFYCGGPT